jgi:hypothetical protein
MEICLRPEPDADPGQAVADRRAHLRVVLADAAHEDDQVDASSAAIMAAICPYQVAEHLDSKPRVGVRQSGLM